MPVHRSEIIETQLLEEGTGSKHAFDVFLGASCHFQHGRHPTEHAFTAFPDTGEESARQQLGQMGRQGADVRRNRHFVIVQYHQQVGLQMAGMIERFERHAGGHGAIADHRHHLAVAVRLLGGDGHAQRRAERGAGMTDAKGIVGAFVPLGETSDTAFAPQGFHPGSTAGQNLVRIGLMAHIPDQAILWRVKHIMQSDGQFHGAQIGGEMPPGLGHGLDEELTQFAGQFRQARFGQLPQVERRIDLFQQRKSGSGGHRDKVHAHS